jgi:hypothetical protein
VLVADVWGPRGPGELNKLVAADLKTGQTRLLDARGHYHRLAASADGKHLAAIVNDQTGGPDKLIFQPAGGKAVTLMPKTGVGFVDPKLAVSDDGKWVCGWVLGEKGGLVMQVWDTATGEAGGVTGEFPRNLSAMSFLAGTKTVAISVNGSGTSPHTVVLADAATGQRTTEAKVPNRNSGFYTLTAVSPGGRHVVFADSDAGMYLQALPSGEVQARLAGHTAAISLVRFTPSGRRVISVANDGTLRVWDVPAN